jgi:hypothetical protein
VVAATVTGRPAASQALRVTLADWAPICPDAAADDLIDDVGADGGTLQHRPLHHSEKCRRMGSRQCTVAPTGWRAAQPPRSRRHAGARRCPLRSALVGMGEAIDTSERGMPCRTLGHRGSGRGDRRGRACQPESKSDKLPYWKWNQRADPLSRSAS